MPGEVPSLAPMLERATPAVVNVATRSTVTLQRPSLFDDPFFRRFFDLPPQHRQREAQSLGSGVIVDAGQGLVLTNHHVIEGAQSISVTLHDGRELEAELLGADPRSDIAVLRIAAEGLVALPMGDSARLRVGDFVVAIGNPFGLGQTVTSGIVSALGRSGLGIEDFEDFIQTDASINPGNSGGALVDLRGRLVGINTAILGPNGGNIGIGFAIPSNMARDIMRQLLAYGEVRRGRLGVSVQDLTPELARAFGLAQQRGVVVSRVEAGSPAAQAGVRPGDVLVALDGRRIRDAEAMRNAIGLLRVDQQVSLRVVRDGRPHELEVRIARVERRQVDAGELSARLAGATLGAEPQSGGGGVVQVVEVQRASAAWRAGLRPGDIILAANRFEVNDLDELRAALARDPRGIRLNIQRGRSSLLVILH